jgi:hypothetical protein
MKNKVIKQVVSRLRKFGFINVNEGNISTDEVYSMYYSKILNEQLGGDPEMDLIINQLLTAMNVEEKERIDKNDWYYKKKENKIEEEEISNS